MELPEIIYEDRHLVAVMKPARIPVASEKSGDVSLLEIVRNWNAGRQEEGKKGYCVPIHFLDRPVSGVILFGLSSKAAARLNTLFRERRIRKTYLAVTSEVPVPAQARLKHWLAKDRDENFSKVVASGFDGAKLSELEYKVLAQTERLAMVQVNPVTGRSHQIRAQMSAIGCALLGDTKYGARSPWDGMVALHAAQLEFEHPVGGKKMCLKARLPDYWREIWPLNFPELSKT